MIIEDLDVIVCAIAGILICLYLAETGDFKPFDWWYEEED